MYTRQNLSTAVQLCKDCTVCDVSSKQNVFLISLQCHYCKCYFKNKFTAWHFSRNLKNQHSCLIRQDAIETNKPNLHQNMHENKNAGDEIIICKVLAPFRFKCSILSVGATLPGRLEVIIIKSF